MYTYVYADSVYGEILYFSNTQVYALYENFMESLKSESWSLFFASTNVEIVL